MTLLRTGKHLIRTSCLLCDILEKYSKNCLIIQENILNIKYTSKFIEKYSKNRKIIKIVKHY